MAKKTTYQSFIQKYISGLPADFIWQDNPVQIYRLESLSKFLVTPTPLLQTNYHSIVIMNSGSYNHQIGIEYLNVDSASVLFIQEGVPFSIKAINEPLNGFLILVQNKSFLSVKDHSEVADYFSIDPLISLNEENRIWLNNLCELLVQELNNQKTYRRITTGLLQALLYKLEGLSGKSQNLNRQEKLAIQFKQLVNKNFKLQKEVSFYALELNVSSNHLNRCVKSFYNKSCKQIIQDVTILQSQVLMFNTSLDIKEISFRVGFDDPSYFSRLFKKLTGKTPKAFKMEIMHDLS